MSQFGILKVAQAAAVLLKEHPGKTMGRLRLLKLLYLADRESLKQRGHTITHDRVVAMKHGPVLSRTYNLIKGEDPGCAEWERYISCVGPIDVQLVKSPGNGKLSLYEIETLQRVSRERRDESEWAVADETHELPEYKKNAVKTSMKPIPLSDILDAVGLGGERTRIEKEDRAHAMAAKIFRSQV
jgi:uncharacterized phage-associated protein